MKRNSTLIDKLKTFLGYKPLEPEREDGIGIYWLWQFPQSHPFTPAAKKHDKAYEDRKAGKNSNATSKADDATLLVDMLAIAKNQENREYYTAQAYLFYFLARAWGTVRWPDMREEEPT